MNVMVRKMVDAISEKVLSGFYDLENHEYSLDHDCETGVNEASMSFSFPFGRKSVDCNLKLRNGCLLYVDVLFDDSSHSNIELAVNEHVASSLNPRELYAMMVEDYRDRTMDEYQRNGFRSASDFWHWKEGR